MKIYVEDNVLHINGVAIPSGSFYVSTTDEVHVFITMRGHELVSNEQVDKIFSDKAETTTYADYTELMIVLSPFLTAAGDSGNKGSDIVIIDKIPLPLDALYYPMTAFRVEMVFKKFAPRVGENLTYFFENYNFRIINTTASPFTVIEEKIKFSSLTDIANWLNANLANNGMWFEETTVFEIYDKINFNMPVISNIYGINTLISSFSGGKYKSHHGHAAACNWNDAYTMFADLFNEAFGLALSGVDFSTGSNRKAVWLPQNYVNYIKPLWVSSDSSCQITFPQDTDRRCYNTISSAFEDIDFNIDNVWLIDSILYLNAQMGDTPSYTVRQVGNRGVVETADELRGVDNYRGVVCYSLYSKNNINKKAIIFKGLGVDTAVIDFVDFNIYDLEIVRIPDGNSQGREYIKVIRNDTDLSGNSAALSPDSVSMRLFLNKEDWWHSGNSGQYNKKAKWTLKSPKTYFRLRNKITKEISKISDKYIGNRSNIRGYFPFAHIVKTDKY